MGAEVIAYLRVSTKPQGASGSGLEGQQATVESYARQAGTCVGAWYVEVESGRRADRPDLVRALGHAGLCKATLVVARLDRLARDPQFLAALANSSVEFVACDIPAANRLSLPVLAAVAEAEAEAASDRIKASLSTAKARGTRLGSARPGHWEGREGARLAGARAGAVAAARARAEAADAAYADLMPIVASLKAEGLSLRAIAARLNADGRTTRRGKPWNPVQVARVLRRAAGA